MIDVERALELRQHLTWRKVGEVLARELGRRVAFQGASVQTAVARDASRERSD